MKKAHNSEYFDAFIKNEFKTIITSISGFDEEHNDEHLHTLRVSIKKIRAVMRVLYQNHQHSKKALKQLKVLFREAGAVREMQLNANMLEKYGLKRYKAYFKLKHQIKKSSEHLIQNCATYKTIAKQSLKQLQKETAPISIHKLQKRILKEETILIKLINKNVHTSNQLHEIRKQLKTLQYVFKFLPEQQKLLFTLQFKDVSPLQERIGHWHDLESHYIFIKKEIPEMKELLENLHKLKTKEFRECYSHLKILLQKNLRLKNIPTEL